MKTAMRGVKALVLVLLFGASAGVFAMCGVCGVDVMGEKGESAAISVTKHYADNKLIDIDAKGLVPGGVYSVWLVTETPAMDMAGAGKAPYAFTADENGTGGYLIDIKASELAKWQKLKVVRHKDGNAENMAKANMETAFVISTAKLLKKEAAESASYHHGKDAKYHAGEAASHHKHEAEEASTYHKVSPEARSY